MTPALLVLIIAYADWLSSPLHAQMVSEPIVIKAGILVEINSGPLPISRLDLPPDALAIDGARLGTQDNQTTGRFLNQTFELVDRRGSAAELIGYARDLLSQGVHFFIVSAREATLLELSGDLGEDALVFNISATNNRLRQNSCRGNIIHVVPSLAMLTDALAQYLMWKRWNKWLLVSGSHEDDIRLAASYRRSATRFGAKIVEERLFEDTGGARRSDTGHVLVQRQIPQFMQRAPGHDIVVAADASHVFGQHLPFRTWSARPVVGSAGLTASSWHAAHESWGATQFQRRFEAMASRHMQPADYLAWMAARVVGEAASRTRSGAFDVLRAYILSPKFSLAAFKGQKITIRHWNQQFRQPLLLGDGKLVVSVSPQEQFLHQRTRLDTLGIDKPESTCDFSPG